MRKVTVCIPSFRRPESLAIVYSNLLSNASHIDEILIGITKDEESSIGHMRDNIEQIAHAFDILGIETTIRVELAGLLDAKIWFKETARNEIVLFMDDDAILGEGYFDLLDHFDDDKVAAVSGVLQTPVNSMGYADWSNEPITVEGNISNTMFFDDKAKTLLWRDKHQVYMHTEDKVFNCEYLIGTALFVKRDLVDIDLEFQRGACAGEELDFTYSMYRRGHKLLFDSSVICWHMHENKGGMRNQDRSKDQENLTYLVQKWGLGDSVESGISIYKEKE